MNVLSLALALVVPVGGGPDTLYAIDLYGLRTVSEAAVRMAIGVRAGDPTPKSLDSIRARLMGIPGVAEVDLSAVCCGEDGGTILYVGIREAGTPSMSYRAAPTGTDRLPAEILALEARFAAALESAVRRGATREDQSQGYALSEDSALRAVQEQFLAIASQRIDLLRSVLLSSGDAEHRALATLIMAYGTDRRSVVVDLVHAVGDPDGVVRNNATRALWVLAAWASKHPEAGVVIPADPFIAFLNSVSWTDRNKGVLALMSLTATRDAGLLSELRARALPSLVEIARWRSAGHAFPAFVILARMAGVADDEAWKASSPATANP